MGLQHRVMAELFEHYVGNELIYQSQLHHPHVKVKYWRDAAGPEVDYVLDASHQFIPIEVKWSDMPRLTDARHLIKFTQEYPSAKMSYMVCRTPKRYKLAENVTVIPWQEINKIFEEIESVRQND